MKTTEGNKLIAEFMYPNAKEEYESGDITIEDGVFKKGMLIFGHSDQMRYHKSWDWLMPVVEKIETLELLPNDNWFNVTIGGSKYCTIHDSNGEIAEFMGDAPTKILCVWFAVIEFIKWYNKNK